MKHSEVAAMIAVVPGLGSARARRYASEFATRASAGMGLDLPPPTASPFAPGAAPAPAPVVLPGLTAAPPSWSPDAALAAPAPLVSVFSQQAQPVATATAATDGSSGSWWTWPPSGAVLAAGGGVLALAVLAFALLRRRSPASAPVIVVSGSGQSSPAKANRPRFVRRGR